MRAGNDPELRASALLRIFGTVRATGLLPKRIPAVPLREAPIGLVARAISSWRDGCRQRKTWLLDSVADVIDDQQLPRRQP
jgi:hypothetical protein